MWPGMETGLTRWIDRLPHSAGYLDGVMRVLANDLVFAIPLVCLVLWVRRSGFGPVLEAVAASALALGVTALIGALWDRPRPFVRFHFHPLIAHAADASFPSDHLAVFGAVSGIFLAYTWRLGLPAVLAALAVAFARVFVGVHYVSDVVDGFLIGLACALVVLLLARPCSPLLRKLDARLQAWRLRPVLLDG